MLDGPTGAVAKRVLLHHIWVYRVVKALVLYLNHRSIYPVRKLCAPSWRVVVVNHTQQGRVFYWI